MGIFRKGDNEKRLASARADLGAARAQLTAIDGGKAAALSDNAAFVKWQHDRSEAAIEVDRLTALVATIEGDAETARIHDEAEAKRRRLAEARMGAADLAKRVVTDGPRIAAEAMHLLKAVAQQQLEAVALNRNLPEGELPIPVADVLARDAGALPRKDLNSHEIELWVSATTGELIGDQRNVVISDDGATGFANIGPSMRWRCVRRKFRQVEYLPQQVFDFPAALSIERSIFR